MLLSVVTLATAHERLPLRPRPASAMAVGWDATHVTPAQVVVVAPLHTAVPLQEANADPPGPANAAPNDTSGCCGGGLGGGGGMGGAGGVWPATGQKAIKRSSVESVARSAPRTTPRRHRTVVGLHRCTHMFAAGPSCGGRRRSMYATS